MAVRVSAPFIHNLTKPNLQQLPYTEPSKNRWSPGNRSKKTTPYKFWVTRNKKVRETRRNTHTNIYRNNEIKTVSRPRPREEHIRECRYKGMAPDSQL